MEKRVVIAKRMLFICAVFMILGILLNFFVFKNDYVSLSLIALSLITLLTYLIVKKQYKFTICLFVFILLGGFNFYTRVWYYKHNIIDTTCTVIGRVAKDVDIISSKQILLENVILENDDFCKKNEKLRVSIYGGYNENESFNLSFAAGDVISFTAKIKTTYFLSTNGGVNSLLTKGVLYTCAVNTQDIQIVENKSTLKILLTNSIYRNLLDNMSEENAALSYAILFGDNDYLQDDILTAFSGAGLSHLLAVSGLHVSIFFAVVMFLINKIKVKKCIAFVLVAFVLLLYAYLCSFSPSVVRAIILSLVLFLSTILGRKYDLLNSIGFAALITLTINPLYLFSLGFLLSYSCVFSIALFGKNLSSKFAKGLFRKVISIFCVSICASLGILPFSLKYFSSLSLISAFANIVFIPIFSVIYVLNILACAFSFVGVNFLFKVTAPLFEFFIESTKFLAALDFNFKVAINVPIIIVLLFFFILFLLSKKYMVSKMTKVITCMIILILGCVSICGNLIDDRKSVIVYMDYNNRALAISLQDKSVINIDTSKEGIEYLTKILNANNITSLQSVLICQDFTSSIYFKSFIERFNVSNIFVSNDLLQGVKNDGLNYGNVFSIDYYESDFIEFNQVELTNSKSVYMFSLNDVNYVIKPQTYTLSEQEYLERYDIDIEIDKQGVFNKKQNCYVKTYLPYYVLK